MVHVRPPKTTIDVPSSLRGVAPAGEKPGPPGNTAVWPQVTLAPFAVVMVPCRLT